MTYCVGRAVKLYSLTSSTIIVGRLYGSLILKYSCRKPEHLLQNTFEVIHSNVVNAIYYYYYYYLFITQRMQALYA